MCTPPQKKHKYLDDPFVPPHHDHAYRNVAPYQPTPPMAAGIASTSKPAPPMYAEFETSKKGSGTGDELPQMPSWDGAASKKVQVEEEAVELEQMKKPEVSQNVPLMANGASSHPTSPNLNGGSPPNAGNPYGGPAPIAAGAYGVGRSGSADPYSRNGSTQDFRNQGNGGYDQGYGQDTNRGYGNAAYSQQDYRNEEYGSNQGYGMAAGAVPGGALSAGRRSPPRGFSNDDYGRGPMNNQGFQQSRAPQPYDNYDTPGTGNGSGNGQYMRQPPRRPAFPGGDSYGNPNSMRSSPGPGFGPRQGPYERSGSSAGGYGGRPYPPPERQYSSESTRPLARPAPEREYSDPYFAEPQPSPIHNTGGFDFNSGFSRPQTPKSPTGPTGQQAGNAGPAAYPGYRAYKPSNP
jgi:hypothetical protein